MVCVLRCLSRCQALNVPLSVIMSHCVKDGKERNNRCILCVLYLYQSLDLDGRTQGDSTYLHVSI